jgi:hypothetical protein
MKYWLDENTDQLYAIQLRRRGENLSVMVIGDPGAPPKGSLDPDILLWCEEYGFVLVTNNRKSMPVHLADHLALGRHAPGIFILNPKKSVGETIDELILVAATALVNEYQDNINFLPLSWDL